MGNEIVFDYSKASGFIREVNSSKITEKTGNVRKA